jgi:hypothetical protein
VSGPEQIFDMLVTVGVLALISDEQGDRRSQSFSLENTGQYLHTVGFLASGADFAMAGLAPVQLFLYPCLVKRQAGRAVVGSNVIYAAIHEFGGTIRPKEKAALAFQVDDHWVVVQSVQMPARPYLQPALESKQQAVAETLANTLYEALMP